jgi:transcriptional regulator with XRE-family HTH domain
MTTTSQTATWLERPEGAVRTPRRAEAFIEARNRGQLHQLLLAEFVKSGMSQAELARRSGKPRETISRVLGHPTNLEINTASKLLYAISGKALTFGAYDPLAPAAGLANSDHRPHWADPPLEVNKESFKIEQTDEGSRTGNSAPAAIVSWVHE